jgi:undecaprenyl-diphosphatase
MDINTRIFFRINRVVNKNWFLDAFGRAGAEWVPIAMIGWYTTFLFLDQLPNIRAIFLALAFLGSAIILAWLLNLLIGFIIKKPRPYITYPQTKVLLYPYPYFGKKTFPSDHTTIAFLIFFMGLMLHITWSWQLLPMALWVGWGRVYAGVHYPADILGGIIMAVLVAIFFHFNVLPFLHY